jgi:excisionase family DNA binding protein
MDFQISNLRQWDDLPLVLTTSEVAEVLRLQRRTVTRMLVAGRLRGVKTGKDWRVARVEVERFMNVTREQAGPVAATNQQTGDELTLAEVDAETWANDPMTKLIGAFAGGPADLSSRHHEYYAEALAAEAGA